MANPARDGVSVPIGNGRGDPQVCLVVGCVRKALYRSNRIAQRGSDRGYCREHKALAIATTKTQAAIERFFKDRPE